MKRLNLVSLFLALAAAIPSCPQPASAVVTNPAVQTESAFGNGVNQNFTIGFDFRDNSWLGVELIDFSTNPASELNVPFGAGPGKFTLSSGNPATTVIMGTPPNNFQRVLIERHTPITQTVDYVETDAFPATDHEQQMDKMVMVEQEIAFAEGTGGGGDDGGGGGGSTFGGLPPPLANHLIEYNGASALDYAPPASVTPVAGDTLYFDGTQWTDYALLTQLGLLQGEMNNFVQIGPYNVQVASFNSQFATNNAQILALQNEIDTANGFNTDPRWNANKLEGYGISTSAPAANDGLWFLTGQWTHAPLQSMVVATGVDTIPEWNANELLSIPMDFTGLANNDILQYRSLTDTWVPVSITALALPPLTDAHIFVGNSLTVATDVPVSGDLTLNDTGVFTVVSAGGQTSTNIALATSSIAASTNHGVLVGSATDTVNSTSAGVLGQVLTSQGAGADPIYAAVAVTPGEIALPSGDLLVGNGGGAAAAVAASGDITNTNAGVFTVGSVGGSTAANIHTATVNANNSFTTGSVLFQGVGTYAQDNPNFFWDDTNHRLGLGTAAPNAALDVRVSGIPIVQVTNTGAQSGGGGGLVQVLHDSGAAMTSGNRLGGLQFGGAQDSSSTFYFGSNIVGDTTENWDSTHGGTQLLFATTPNGTHSRTLAFTLDQDQTATFAAQVTAPTIQLTTAPTTGYVWTATDNAGHGSWQASSSSGALTNTHIFVGNASNVATDVAMSGDTSIANTGAVTVNTVGGQTSANVALVTSTVAGSTNHGVLLGTGTDTVHSTTAGTAGQVLTSNGAGADPTYQTAGAGGFTAPTIQILTSGTTYTTPTSPAPLYIRVEMVGGGGGGGACGSSVGGSPAGTHGGDTVFGPMTAGGGGRGIGGNSERGFVCIPNVHSSTTLGGVTGVIETGNQGGAAAESAIAAAGTTSPEMPGGSGGVSPFGGGAGPSSSAAANSGSGGGGGSTLGGTPFVVNYISGSGGCSGDVIRAIIPSPAATYTYSIGTQGTGASPTDGCTGQGDNSGGDAGGGLVRVTEYYQ